MYTPVRAAKVSKFKNKQIIINYEENKKGDDL